MKWRYGDSWERYPIMEGELWTDEERRSAVAVHDLRDGAPSHMLGCELLYCDPPWSQGKVNAFITNAGRSDYVNSFHAFMLDLFRVIGAIAPRACYLEIGKQHRVDFRAGLEALFPVVQQWEITYYRKHSCYLLYGGASPVLQNYTGMDDEDTPGAVIANERPLVVGDMCTGRGLTAVAAYRESICFLGAELNPRKLAVAIDLVNKLGGRYARTVPA